MAPTYPADGTSLTRGTLYTILGTCISQKVNHDSIQHTDGRVTKWMCYIARGIPLLASGFFLLLIIGEGIPEVMEGGLEVVL